MKKLIFLLVAVLLTTAQLYSQWTLQSNPMGLTDEIYAVFPVNASTVYAVCEREIVLKTTNAGTNWFKQKEGVSTRSFLAVWFLNENTGFVAGGYNQLQYDGCISKTTNGGANWKDTVISGTEFNSLYFINANTGFAGGTILAGNSPLYKTTNGGAAWFSFTVSAYGISDIDFINENTGWAAATTAGGEAILKTTDGGNNWSIVSSLGGGISLSSIDFVNANNGWISGNMGSPYGGLLRKSTDGGVTWFQQTNHNSNIIWSLCFLNENTGWATGQPELLQKTTNGGINWNQQSTPAANWIMDVKFVNENTGWAVGSQGKIFYTSNGGGSVSVQNISSEVPSSYSLKQNYPNPFNNTSNLKFQISKLGNVKIIVYDVMGREVQMLVNETLQPRIYETTFDGSMLPSGVYFYKLTSGDFSETKRMLMIK
jgi:photosystem II stability/assembly factor-like uncharacterized protein